jgi:hypothetical protein
VRQIQNTSSSRKPRVAWTDDEKAKIVGRAVQVQAEHPDLAGLPLLRASMSIFPASRWRKLIAVTQAAWFEPGVAAEVKMRTNEERARGSVAPLIKAQVAEQAAQAASWMNIHRAWQNEEHADHVETVFLLKSILGELQAINAKLGQPVPVIAPCVCADDTPVRSRKRSSN